MYFLKIKYLYQLIHTMYYKSIISIIQMHWTLIMLDFEDKVIYYVDSLGGSGDYIFKNVLQYLKDEHIDKKKTEYKDIDEWECISCRNFTPQQHNGSDCGVFMLATTEFLSEGFEQLKFTQSEMSYFRQRLLCLIMHQSLIEQKNTIYILFKHFFN